MNLKYMIFSHIDATLMNAWDDYFVRNHVPYDENDADLWENCY